MAAVARAQAAARQQYLDIGLPQPEPALPPRPLGPKSRAAALALAAWELAGDLAPLPRALDEIARRVREWIRPAPQPGDDALVADLHRLRERAFALSLDVYRLGRLASLPVRVEKR